MGNEYDVEYDPADSTSNLFRWQSQLARASVVAYQLPDHTNPSGNMVNFIGDNLTVEFPWVQVIYYDLGSCSDLLHR